jgi:hypothetical protein
VARTEQRHVEIHALMAQGLTVSAIARRVRLDRKTVRRFAAAEVAAELLGTRGRRATALDPYLPYLASRWRAGQHVGAYLFDEVWQQGYRGSKRTVRRQVAGWRTAEPPPPAHVMLPGPRTLAWLMLRRPSDLDDTEQVLLNSSVSAAPSWSMHVGRRSTSCVWCVSGAVASWTRGLPRCTQLAHQNYAGSAATWVMIGMPSAPGSLSAGARDL